MADDIQTESPTNIEPIVAQEIFNLDLTESNGFWFELYTSRRQSPATPNMLEFIQRMKQQGYTVSPGKHRDTHWHKNRVDDEVQLWQDMLAQSSNRQSRECALYFYHDAISPSTHWYCIYVLGDGLVSLSN
jgi:hypothetical protein